MGKVIPVSFKKNETYLYDEVMKHSSHGGFIKECIKKCMEIPNQENKKPPYDEGFKSNEIGDLINSL